MAQASSSRLSTPTRPGSGGRKSSGSKSVLVWLTVLALGAIALFSVWRLRDGEPRDRSRSLLSLGEPLDKLAGRPYRLWLALLVWLTG